MTQMASLTMIMTQGIILHGIISRVVLTVSESALEQEQTITIIVIFKDNSGHSKYTMNAEFMTKSRNHPILNLTQPSQ